MNFRFPHLIRPFLGKLIWRMSPTSKVIFLTFDDGPVPEVTPYVLDILDNYKLKATFFCVGENIRKYPELFEKVIQRGHQTGNHTFNHLKGVSVSTTEYVENVEKASVYFENNLFRPPYGRITFWQKKTLHSKFKIVMWDVLTRDYDRKLSPEFILKNIKQLSRNGSIVVFHDSLKAKENVLNVLPSAIEFWMKEGYTFGIL